jgi:hypothetical protein
LRARTHKSSLEIMTCKIVLTWREEFYSLKGAYSANNTFSDSDLTRDSTGNTGIRELPLKILKIKKLKARV